VKLRNRLLLLLLPLVLAGQSAALTLGRVRGAAVVGQPLDIVVQIQLNSDEAATALCAEADVFHADSRQDPGRVRVTVEPTAQSGTVNARVISSSFIDEPMVTVYLRAGCGQKSSRRYVLLADFPSETALPVMTPSASPPTAALPATTAMPAAAESASSPTVTAQRNGDLAPTPPTARLATAPKTAPRLRPPARPKPAKASANPIPSQPNPPAPKIAAAAPVVATPPAAQVVEKVQKPKEASSAAGQSRLTLDPLVVLAERVANLESSSSAPASDGTRDGVRDAQRMQSLEDSVKTLVALAAKNEASLQDMRLKVQAAQADRVPVQWLYGLVALVLACLAAMAYLWSRLSAGAMSGSAKDDWWRAGRNAPLSAAAGGVAMPQEVATEVQQSAAGKLVSKPVALQGRGVDSRVESRYSSLTGLEDDPASELDVSLVEMTESNFDQLMKSGKSHSAIRPGPLSPQVEPMPATTKMQALAVRPINSDQLFDVRQQADFFVSLGQTDQAVQILEKQINEHGETSPLIYLDLLQIFHSLNLKTDFRQFREDFNLLFNARVPEFAAFRNEGKSLEEYPHVLAHIAALWSTRKALMVIEASIFRDSLDDRSTPFDLAAFRDLLLLHAIAQSFTVREEATSDLAPLRTNMAPISKGARLAALTGSAGPASGNFDAEGTVDISLPPPSGLAQVDISLTSSGAALLPTPNLPSVTGVLNAPTMLDPMASKSASGSGGLDLELDLDLSGLVALSPTHASKHSSTQKPGDNELSDFSKLLKAQAPAGPGTQGFKAKAAAAESGNSGPESQAGYLADNLLDFDLSSENAKLATVKPKGNKSKPT
jgi:pilus assembly protein FimV